MGLSATYPGVLQIESADYALTCGISPGVAHVVMLPQAGVIPTTGDLALSDGTTTLVLKECRAAEAPARSDKSGRTWTLALMDRRWRWRFGKISGKYNVCPPGKDKPNAPDERQSARDLAKMLLDEMALAGAYDAGALPADDYPEVQWDYANPASELSALCDRYGTAIAYDPENDRVALKALGTGETLPRNVPYESWEITVPATDKPKELIALAEKDEYEGPLELEAVGLDVDGAVKPLASLSYKPATWDFYEGEMINLSAAEHAVADDSLFRWYRLKDSVDVIGWKVCKREECLPWMPRRVTKVTELTGEGKLVDRNMPMFVDAKAAGMADPDATANTNIAKTILDVSFSTDDERGLIMFSRPVWKWSGASCVGADLRLWATVPGDRYERKRDMGGPEGKRYVFVPGVVRQFISGASLNQAEVDAALDRVLNAQEKQYKDPQNSGRANYIGLVRQLLDGAIRSVSYSVDKAGATTVIAFNDDTAYQADIVRKGIEAQARFKRKMEQYRNEIDAELLRRRQKE
jgi:hypothetical protein